MVDDRRRIVTADDAAVLRLELLAHSPWLGDVLVGDALELRDVAPHVPAAGVEARLLARRVEDAPADRGRVDADRGDPLPVAVVAGLVAVEQQAHEVALAPAPIDPEVFDEERGDDEPGTVVHPSLDAQLAHRRVDERESGSALPPRVERLAVLAPVDPPAPVGLVLAMRAVGEMAQHVGVEVAPAELTAIVVRRVVEPALQLTGGNAAEGEVGGEARDRLVSQIVPSLAVALAGAAQETAHGSAPGALAAA